MKFEGSPQLWMRALVVITRDKKDSEATAWYGQWLNFHGPSAEWLAHIQPSPKFETEWRAEVVKRRLMR